MNIFEKIYCRTYQTFFRAALPILPYRVPERLKSIDKIPDLIKNSMSNQYCLSLIPRFARRILPRGWYHTLLKTGLAAQSMMV